MTGSSSEVAAALNRDFVWESLAPAAADLEACLASLSGDDDVGAVYHFRRFVARVRAAAPVMRELDAKGLAAEAA